MKISNVHTSLPLLNRTAYTHSVKTIQARIQAAAPLFTADAVVNGDVGKISLKNFRG